MHLTYPSNERRHSPPPPRQHARQTRGEDPADVVLVLGLYTGRRRFRDQVARQPYGGRGTNGSDAGHGAELGRECHEEHGRDDGHGASKHDGFASAVRKGVAIGR